MTYCLTKMPFLKIFQDKKSLLVLKKLNNNFYLLRLKSLYCEKNTYPRRRKARCAKNSQIIKFQEYKARSKTLRFLIKNRNK